MFNIDNWGSEQPSLGKVSLPVAGRLELWDL